MHVWCSLGERSWRVPRFFLWWDMWWPKERVSLWVFFPCALLLLVLLFCLPLLPRSSRPWVPVAWCGRGRIVRTTSPLLKVTSNGRRRRRDGRGPAHDVCTRPWGAQEPVRCGTGDSLLLWLPACVWTCARALCLLSFVGWVGAAGGSNEEESWR